MGQEALVATCTALVHRDPPDFRLIGLGADRLHLTLQNPLGATIGDIPQRAVTRAGISRHRGNDARLYRQRKAEPLATPRRFDLAGPTALAARQPRQLGVDEEPEKRRKLLPAFCGFRGLLKSNTVRRQSLLSSVSRSCQR